MKTSQAKRVEDFLSHPGIKEELRDLIKDRLSSVSYVKEVTKGREFGIYLRLESSFGEIIDLETGIKSSGFDKKSGGTKYLVRAGFIIPKLYGSSFSADNVFLPDPEKDYTDADAGILAAVEEFAKNELGPDGKRMRVPRLKDDEVCHHFEVGDIVFTTVSYGYMGKHEKMVKGVVTKVFDTILGKSATISYPSPKGKKVTVNRLSSEFVTKSDFDTSPFQDKAENNAKEKLSA